MEESNLKIYRSLGFFGVGIWLIAHFTSSQVEQFSSTYQLLLSIMPNLGIVIFLPFILLSYANRIYKDKEINEKKIFYTSLIILVLLLIIDQVINILFKGMYFDIYSIVVYIMSIILDIIIFKIISYKN